MGRYRYFYHSNTNGKLIEVSEKFYKDHLVDLTEEGHQPCKILKEKVNENKVLKKI